MSLRSVLRVLMPVGALALAVTPNASAAGGLSLAPSYIDAKVRAGTQLPPLRVTNSSGRPLALTAAFFRATADRSGLPIYQTSPRERAAGAQLLRVAPGRVTIAPGQSTTLALTVARRPRRGIALYGVVAVTARPIIGGKSPQGAVAVPRLRISANVLLHFPGVARRRVHLEAVNVHDQADGTPELVATLRGTGNTDVRRGGRVLIADAAGHAKARLRLDPVRVLPGAQRDNTVALPAGLAPGEYVARAVVRGAGSATTAFRVDDSGRLAHAALRLVSVTAHPDGDSRVRVSATVRNAGTQAGSGDLALELVRAGGERVNTRHAAIGTVPANGSKTVTLELPAGATKGAQVLASLNDGGLRLGRETAVVTAQPSKGAATQDWLAAHIPLLLAFFLGTILAIVAGFAAWIRRIRLASN